MDLKAQVRSEFEAYLFLRSASKAKYGSLLQTLQQQYSLGQAHYPDSIHKAADILSQHPWDKTPSQQNKQNNNRNSLFLHPIPNDNNNRPN